MCNFLLVINLLKKVNQQISMDELDGVFGLRRNPDATDERKVDLQVEISKTHVCKPNGEEFIGIRLKREQIMSREPP